eukprot:2386143-Heterocapsa_arctica.AAC.1
MEATRARGLPEQHQQGSASSSERPCEGRKRASAEGGARETRGRGKAEGPSPPDPLATSEGGDRGGSGAPLGQLVRVENRAAGPPEP